MKRCSHLTDARTELWREAGCFPAFGLSTRSRRDQRDRRRRHRGGLPGSGDRRSASTVRSPGGRSVAATGVPGRTGGDGAVGRRDARLRPCDTAGTAQHGDRTASGAAGRSRGNGAGRRHARADRRPGGVVRTAAGRAGATGSARGGAGRAGRVVAHAPGVGARQAGRVAGGADRPGRSGAGGLAVGRLPGGLCGGGRRGGAVAGGAPAAGAVVPDHRMRCAERRRCRDRAAGWFRRTRRGWRGRVGRTAAGRSSRRPPGGAGRRRRPCRLRDFVSHAPCTARGRTGAGGGDRLPGRDHRRLPADGAGPRRRGPQP